MLLLKTIFRHEWKQLTQQRWMWISLLAFVLISVLSLVTGRRSVQTRLTQIDSIHTAYNRDYAAVLKKFTDTSSAKAKTDAKNAGMPVMINFRLPQPAIKTPATLSPLATGMMDILPWYQQIRYVKNFNEAAVVPVSNPLVLFAGSFDYSFVLIYLLPLLIISWCYAVFDSEKNAGTIRLLAVQSGKPETIFRLKLLFRAVLLAAVVVLLNIAGFVVCSGLQDTNWMVYGWWMLLSLLYLLFWFALCRLFVAFRKSGIATALYLITSWLALLLVIPSLCNTYMQAKYPLPLQDEIAAYRRHQSEEIWNSAPKLLADSFNKNNPQYAASINEAKDTVKLSDRYVAGYYDLLERRMNRVLQPLQQQMQTRNTALKKLLAWNPASFTQGNLAGLAGTNLAAYDFYSAKADSFQKRWQAFLYPYHLADQLLKPEQFSYFPQFGYQDPSLDVAHLWRSIILLSLFSLLFLVLSNRADRYFRFI